MRLFLFILLTLLALFHEAGASSANKESEKDHHGDKDHDDIDRIIKLTKIVKEEKIKFAQSMAETKARIKAFVTEQYDSLKKDEAKLRALEKILRDEVVGVVKTRRLNMNDIEAGAEKIKRRRLNNNNNNNNNNQENNQDNDIMMDRKDANKFLQPGENRKLYGFVGEAVETVADVATDVVDTVSDAASSAWDTVSDWAGDLVGAAKEAWEFMEKIEAIISNSVTKLWTFVKGIINNIGDIFNKIGEIISEFIFYFFSPLVSIDN